MSLMEPYDPVESRNRALGLPADTHSETDTPHKTEKKDFRLGIRDLGNDGWELSVAVTSGRVFYYQGDRDRMLEIIDKLEKGAKMVRDSISLHDCPLCGGKVMCLPKRRFFPLGIRFECLDCASTWNYARNTDFDEEGNIYPTRRRLFTDRTKACGWWDRFALVLLSKKK